jgi:hypothetical protein
MMQIDMDFRPMVYFPLLFFQHTGSFAAEMELTYDTGEKNRIELTGTAEDADIRLEKHTLQLDQTYISLMSAKTVRIHNRSGIMAKFSWKQFATDVEERNHRAMRLVRMEIENAEEDSQFELDMLKEKDATLYDISVLKQRHKVSFYSISYALERSPTDRERVLLFHRQSILNRAARRHNLAKLVCGGYDKVPPGSIHRS